MIQYDEQGNIIGMDASALNQPDIPTPAAVPAPSSPDPAPFSFADMPVAPEPEEDPGFLDYAADIVKGTWNGVVGAVQETGQFAYDVADLAADFEDKTVPGYEFLEGLKGETETLAGSVAEGVSNFVTAFVGAGKFLKTARLLQGGGKALLAGRGLAQGAAADFIAIDPLEDRLSNLVESYPLLSNPISRALAAEADDNRWEGRFKNSVEGLGLGLATEAMLTTAVKGLRAWRKGDGKALEASLNALDAATGGKPAPKFREVDAESFIELRSKSSRPEFLTPYTAEDMRGWKHFATEDGVGFTLTDKMDIVGVINNSGVKGAGQEAVIEAVSLGGKTLDCVGGFLDGYYERFGFKEIKRVPWNDLEAPKGWNYEKYGRHDIIFFEYPEGLSRDRGDIRRRFEAARTGESGSGPLGPGSGGGKQQQAPAAVRSGVDAGEQGALKGGTGADRLHVENPPATGKAAGEAIAQKHSPEAIGGELYRAAKADSRNYLELRLNKRNVINPARFSFATGEGLRVHVAVSELTFKDTILGKEGSKSLAEITGEGLAAMEDLGFDMSQVREYVTKVADKLPMMKQAAKDNFMLQDMAAALVDEYDYLALALPNATGEAAEEMARRFATIEQSLGEVATVLSDYGNTAARALKALSRVSEAGEIKITAKELRQRLEKTRFADLSGNPKALVKYALAGRGRGRLEYATEAFINNILSGPLTHAVNIGSNAVKVTLTPVYRVLGHLAHRDVQAMKNDLRMYNHLWHSTMPAARFALKALREDRTVLEGLQGLGWTEGLKGSKVEKAWSRDNVLTRYLQKQIKKGAAPEQAVRNIPLNVEIWANVSQGLGKIINAPTRIMKMEDEFFKQLTYRSELRDNLTAEALEKMPNAGSKDIAEYIASQEAAYFDGSGGGLDKALLQKAREATFSQDLTGPIGKAAQDLSNSHPLIKLAVPFVRTPSNLLLEAYSHTPFALKFSSRFKEAVAQGGKAKAEAEGKVMLGGLCIAATLMLASQGRITGSAPKDPKLREALERQGWRPHSIKIGQSYYSYNRLDPLATLLSATANLAEAAPYISQEGYGEFAATLLSANAALLADKSYLKGVSSLLDAVSGNQREQANLIQNMATGLVPYSSMLGFIRNHSDELRRDVRSVESHILNRIPGYSGDLPAKYDWLTGKPFAQTFGLISPINEDTVARELAVLGGVAKTPGYKLNNVELNEAQHSRYCELIGTIRLDGKNLHQALNAVIRSPAYDLRRASNTDLDGGRSARLQKVVQRYRRAAQKQFAREQPGFVQDKVALRLERQARKTSNGSARLGVPEEQAHPEQRRQLQQLKEFIQ